jgi:DNA primase
MFFRQHFDWDAVAGKSENTKIPVHIMNKLFRDYKKVYIWLDKDEAGIKAQKDYLEKYPKLIPISYKDTVMQKDPTDRYEYLKQAGLQKIALQEIINLIV